MISKTTYLSHPPFGKTKEEHRIYWRWWRNFNRERYNHNRLRWADANRNKRREQARKSHLNKKFNISLEKQEKMLEEQNNKCLICLSIFNSKIDKRGRNTPDFCVDHNHKNGEIRGLICRKCNLGLGYFQESPISLERAIKYVREKSKVGNNKSDDI